MKSISSYFNHICSQKYRSLGFSKNKLTFARISGELLQVFTLKCSQYTSTCTVDFGIFPLCMPHPIYLFAGGYELDNFIIEIHEKDSGWRFDPTSEESIQSCVQSISHAIDLYLLPIFEICNDCKSALSELLNLEELFEHNRQKTLYLRGDSDCAVPWQERSLFDSRKYYMALKAGNYSYAQEYLIHQIDFHKNRLMSFDRPGSPKQPDVVKEKFNAKLGSLIEQLHHLTAEDITYFDKMLFSNETQMIAYLKSQYPKIRHIT